MRYRLEVIVKDYGSHWMEFKNEEEFEEYDEYFQTIDWNHEYIAIEDRRVVFRKENIIGIKVYVEEDKIEPEAKYEPTNSTGDRIVQEGGKLIY